MSFFLALLIGIAVNLDNFIIGMNLGTRGQKLTLRSNIIIGLSTGLCAFFSTYAATLISGNFLVYTNVIGALIMIIFGIYCLLKSFGEEETPTHFSALTLKDAFILGFVLAVNCIPPSFSAGILNLSPLLVALSSALFSCLCMFVSNRLGHRLTTCRMLHFLTPASAILLIFIGIGELLI